LKAGIKNAIAVEGTNIPKTVQELSREKVTTAFVDGDRGGELILRELFQTSEIDFVARAPRAHEVEELSTKQLVKCLRNKVPGDQYMEMNGFTVEDKEPRQEREARSEEEDRPRKVPVHEDRNRRDRGEKRLRHRDDDQDNARKGRERFNNENVERFKKKVEEPADDEPSEEKKDDEPANERPKKGRAEAPSHRDDDERPRKGRPAKPQESAPDKSAAARSLRGKKDRNTKTLSPEQEAFRDMLLDMSSTHNAKLLAEDNSVIREIAVKNLVNSLKDEGSDKIAVIVFDGVISQRILDVSVERGIKTIVGTRKGNITKMPANTTIFTKEDLY
jgi:DNA primase